MPLPVDKIEQLAPDQASLNAGIKLANPKSWPALGIDATKSLIWGECQGSGSSPYRICVSVEDHGYKCTCPSRKFPCKHTIGLMLMHAHGKAGFETQPPPPWVSDWASRRKPGARAGKPAPADAPPPSLKAALAQDQEDKEDVGSDEKTEARLAAQRERMKTLREQSVRAGLDELDRWIGDQLDRGLAAFPAQAQSQCRLAAQRLVDGKATSLATRLDALPSELFTLAEAQRPDFLIETFGGLHLLAEAYRRQERLPPALREDVRRLVGWTIDRQTLLDMADALRVSGTWTVVANHVEVQPDKLRRIETWLMRVGEAPALPAVLIDFVPVAAPAGVTLMAGETFEAELVFFPSATPLRAIIGSRGATRAQTIWPAGADALAAALASYDVLLARQPWLGSWPLAIAAARIARAADGALWLMAGGDGVPVDPRQSQEALVLCDLDIRDIIGLWDGRLFTLMTAATPLGRWLRQ